MPRLARAERGAPRAILLRILSALVLAPIAIAATWLGSPWLPMLTVIAGALMAWEWARLCHRGRLGAVGIELIGIVLIAIVVELVVGAAAALAVTAASAAIIFATARREPDAAAGWLALGALWLAVPCVLFLWLAQFNHAGRSVVLWIFAVVWATDIGAYALGSWIGGPLLAPSWSPRKTWAGLIGGMICAALAGWGATAILDISSTLPLVLLSAGLAIVEQFGDLAESAAKRRFGVKDTSGLIPGHGGLLDRLDGLLAVVPAVALLSLFDGSVLRWR